MRSPLLIPLALLAWGCAGPQVQPFPDVTAALKALASPAGRTSWQAAEFLAARPAESVPRLMAVVREKEEGWLWALLALQLSNDNRTVPFLIALMGDNFYEKEPNGKRIVYGMGSPHGCIMHPFLYGGAIASSLGDIGDKRAVPVLRQATQAGDDEVRRKAYVALYKLGDMDLGGLFEVSRRQSRLRVMDEIEGVGWRAIHSDTGFAISVFDRIITEAQDDERAMAAAHFWKIQCFSLLREYDRAIHECDEVLRFFAFGSLVEQAKRRRAELVKLIERDRAGVGTQPPDGSAAAEPREGEGRETE